MMMITNQTIGVTMPIAMPHSASTISSGITRMSRKKTVSRLRRSSVRYLELHGMHCPLPRSTDTSVVTGAAGANPRTGSLWQAEVMVPAPASAFA